MLAAARLQVSRVLQGARATATQHRCTWRSPQRWRLDPAKTVQRVMQAIMNIMRTSMACMVSRSVISGPRKNSDPASRTV